MISNRRVLLIVVVLISAALLWQLFSGLSSLHNTEMTGGEGEPGSEESAGLVTFMLYGFPCAGLWAGAASRWFLGRPGMAAENGVVCAALALSGFLALPLLFFLWVLTRQ
ncbi:hypothetical protein ACO0LF_27960 [Undibacterium sp. Di27W]|uniref:hypothetical protein n=1 Tax=Undibacterium sp. Di27W TaxID=3413036 RepID=UPI003BF0F820